MEKRIGTVLLLIDHREEIDKLNLILGDHQQLIIARQGIPLHNRRYNLISLIIEGSTDEIGSLTGKLGRLEGIYVKSAVINKKLENRP